MENCLFCKIIKGEIPSYKIYEDDKTFAFLDISNDGNGHILVIPRNHCESILDCNKEDLEGVIVAVKKISEHLVKSCGFSGVNILNNSGKDAEQGVFHLHFHILPRRENDNFKVCPNLPKNEKSLEDICNMIKLGEK